MIAFVDLTRLAVNDVHALDCEMLPSEQFALCLRVVQPGCCPALAGVQWPKSRVVSRPRVSNRGACLGTSRFLGQGCSCLARVLSSAPFGSFPICQWAGARLGSGTSFPPAMRSALLLCLSGPGSLVWEFVANQPM